MLTFLLPWQFFSECSWCGLPHFCSQCWCHSAYGLCQTFVVSLWFSSAPYDQVIRAKWCSLSWLKASRSAALGVDDLLLRQAFKSMIRWSCWNVFVVICWVVLDACVCLLESRLVQWVADWLDFCCAMFGSWFAFWAPSTVPPCISFGLGLSVSHEQADIQTK